MYHIILQGHTGLLYDTVMSIIRNIPPGHTQLTFHHLECISPLTQVQYLPSDTIIQRYNFIKLVVIYWMRSTTLK